MKSPRDILFARHEAAVPKLDAIRQSTVAAVGDRQTAGDTSPERRSQTSATVFQTLWRELIFPSRRIWTGLAAIWVLLFFVNFSRRDGSQMVIAKSTPTVEMMTTFRDQQKLLNELLADRSLPVDAGRPRIFSPKPRTETMELLTV